MPASVVKTPEDKAAWKRAKKAASDTLSPEDGDKYWALVMHIFKKMTHRDEEVENSMKHPLEEFRRLVGFPLEEETKRMTALEMAKAIYDGLPEYHKLAFKAEQGMKLGNEDSVMVSCASVPRNASELDALNSKTQCMIHIAPARGFKWAMNSAAPEKVQAEQFRGSNVKLTKKTASPEKVVSTIIAFFKKNAEAFGAS
jgi:hypothetical protein